MLGITIPSCNGLCTAEVKREIAHGNGVKNQYPTKTDCKG